MKRIGPIATIRLDCTQCQFFLEGDYVPSGDCFYNYSDAPAVVLSHKERRAVGEVTTTPDWCPFYPTWARRQRGKLARVWVVFCATCDAAYIWPSLGFGAEGAEGGAKSADWREDDELGWQCLGCQSAQAPVKGN